MSAIAEATRREQLEADVDAAGVREMYEQILAKGETAEWAAMCALRSPPGAKNTDRAFQDGARRQMNEMDPVNRRHIYRAAIKAGINTQGKYYKGGLGRYTDPQAWVATADDVIATCKRKGLDCEGVVNVKSAPTDKPFKKIPLAPELVNQVVRERVKRDPKLGQKVKDPAQLKRLKAEIVERHGKPSSKS